MGPSSTTQPNDRRSAWDRWLSWKVMVPVVLLMLLITVPVTSRFYFLSFIPPIDEPFDVEAFLADEVPDDENAMVCFRRAIEELGITFDMQRQISFACDPNVGIELTAEDRAVWEREVRELLAAKQSVIAEWRRGVAKPRFQIAPASKIINEFGFSLERTEYDLETLAAFSVAQARSLLMDGDVDAAWSTLIDTYRMGQKIAESGPWFGRMHATSIRDSAARQIVRWAEHPAVDEDLLSRAQRDFREVHSKTPPLSAALRWDYLSFRNALATEEIRSTIERDLLPDWMSPITWAMGEPEFSNRILRHAYKNALDQCDRPLHLQKYRQTSRLLWEPVVNVDPSTTYNTRRSSKDRRVSAHELNAYRHRFPRVGDPWRSCAKYISIDFFGHYYCAGRERCCGLQVETILALQRYHRRKGTFPQALTELVSEGLLDEEPIDPVAMPYPQPMAFEPVANRAWIWSVKYDKSGLPGVPPERETTPFEMQTYRPGERPPPRFIDSDEK